MKKGVIHLAGTDFSHLTNDELINGIQSLKLPDYIRSKAYGDDVRESLAQMTEMTIQLGVNMGLSPEDALKWARKLQETISQSDFDSWVATLLDGGPSIFMNTLSELQTTYPNGASGVALVRETDPAKIYVWNGSAWEDFGQYQGIEVKDGSITSSKLSEGAVTPEITTFLKIGKNLFDKNRIIRGELVNQTNGTINVNASHWRTDDFISIEPNETYTIQPHTPDSTRIAFYSEKNLSSFITGSAQTATMTAPSNAKYLMFSASGPVEPFQLEKNSIATKYESYKLTPTFDILSAGVVTSDVIGRKSVTRNKTDFIISSKNLFTKDDARLGWWYTGSLWEVNENYNATKKIPVEPNTEYVFSQDVVRYLFLNSSGEVSKTGITTSENRVMVSPNDATHIILSMTLGRWNINNLQLEEGTEPTPYEPYSLKLSPEIEVVTATSHSELYGKSILFIGDSNTHVNTWPQMIANRTGATTFNGGMGATRLLDQSNLDETYFYNFLNGCAVADALATGDFTELDYYGGLLDAEVINSNPDYLEQIQNIKDAYAEIENLDSIVISYGTNDVNNMASALGTEDSFDRTTWCGAINYVIKTISEAHPHIKIYFATPPFRAKMSGTVATTSDDGVEGRLYMPEMSEKMVAITKANHLPCLDLYFKSGINKYTASAYLNNLEVDGTHYNNHGEEHVSWLYQKFLENS